MRYRRLADVLLIVLGGHPIDHSLARGVDEAQAAIVKLQVVVVVDQSGVHRGSGAEHRDLIAELVDHVLEEAQCTQCQRLRLRQSRQDAVADRRRPMAH